MPTDAPMTLADAVERATHDVAETIGTSSRGRRWTHVLIREDDAKTLLATCRRLLDPSEADVERVARAFMVAEDLNGGREGWAEVVAIAAIAAMRETQ